MEPSNKELVHKTQTILKEFGYTVKKTHLHEMFARIAGYKNIHEATAVKKPATDKDGKPLDHYPNATPRYVSCPESEAKLDQIVYEFYRNQDFKEEDTIPRFEKFLQKLCEGTGYTPIVTKHPALKDHYGHYWEVHLTHITKGKFSWCVEIYCDKVLVWNSPFWEGLEDGSQNLGSLGKLVTWKRIGALFSHLDEGKVLVHFDPVDNDYEVDLSFKGAWMEAGKVKVPEIVSEMGLISEEDKLSIVTAADGGIVGCSFCGESAKKLIVDEEYDEKGYCSTYCLEADREMDRQMDKND